MRAYPSDPSLWKAPELVRRELQSLIGSFFVKSSMKSREGFGYSETIADVADSDRELLPPKEKKKPRSSVGTSSSEGHGFFYILG